jgi:NADPH:quinone reductase-like Zn-dependent oxidoreductase
MGIHTIQQARIKYPSTFILALALQRHHAMLKRLGADAVFDYNSPSPVQEVRELGS